MLNEIILDAFSKGQSRLEAFESMVNIEWNNKFLQDMHEKIKFAPGMGPQNHQENQELK